MRDRLASRAACCSCWRNAFARISCRSRATVESRSWIWWRRIALVVIYATPISTPPIVATSTPTNNVSFQTLEDRRNEPLFQTPAGIAPALDPGNDRGSRGRKRRGADRAIRKRYRFFRVLLVDPECVIPGRFRVNLPVSELRVVLDLFPIRVDRQGIDQRTARDRDGAV